MKTKKNFYIVAALAAFVFVGIGAISALAECTDCYPVSRNNVYFCNGLFVNWCPEFTYGDKYKCDSPNSIFRYDCDTDGPDDEQLNYEEWDCDIWQVNGAAGYYCTVTATGTVEYAGTTEPPTGSGEIYSSCTFQENVECNCYGCDSERHMGLQVCDPDE